MDFLALKDVFYRKIRILDLKIKIRIRQSQALRFLWKRRLHSDWFRLTLDPVSSKPHCKWRTSCREFRTERIDVALNCRFISTVMFNVVWWWPVLKNSSRLHFVHRMCLVTSFFHDKILMFTWNPLTGERSWKNFQPIQCLWNVSYYIGALHTNFLT